MTQTQQPPQKTPRQASKPAPHQTGWSALNIDMRGWWTKHWAGPVAAIVLVVLNISVWIWQQLKPALPILSAVQVFETADNCVVYRGE